ncbi:MAG: ABC transporter substrate-binding protein [Clostridia bacterium]|nr:ABC transporter substrate-binding protein [Clostridia bacterium]
MKMKRGLLLLLSLAFLLSGCRTRINESGQIPAPSPGQAGETQESGFSGSARQDGLMENNDDTNLSENENNRDRTKENPEASRKEYDENAPAEIAAGTEHLLQREGDGNAASAASDEAESAASRLNSQAEETATQTVAADEAEQMGVSEDAEAAESALTYFSVLIRDRMGSLYECQRATVYWETAQDHVTIHKSSPEHALILEAGAYDASARLLPENLWVDDGWVARKNPQVIVKAVSSGVLGRGVSADRAAKAVYQRLISREGWAGIDAVKNRRVLLLSEELLEAPHLRTAAMLMIAKTAHPALFEDVDLRQALQMLSEEAAGELPAGVYFYTERE